MKTIIILTFSIFSLTCIFSGGAQCASCEGKVCTYSTDCTPLCDCMRLNGKDRGVCV